MPDLTEPKRKTKRPNSVLTLLLFLPFVLSVGWCQGRDMAFDRDCKGHLKRAGDANSVELAEQELRAALDYIEAHGMTEGHAALFYNTPANDMGFWYHNLKSAYDELEALPKDASALERSNMLIKLRETLLDHTSDGESVTAPDKAPIYPYVRLFLFVLIVGGALALAGGVRTIFAWLGFRMKPVEVLVYGASTAAAFIAALLYGLMA